MTFINNVSHESGVKVQPQFILSIYFHFTQKSKQAFYLLKNLTQKTLPQKGFLIFYFLRYSKHFISIILIVIVLLNILPCNSKKIYVYAYIFYK